MQLQKLVQRHCNQSNYNKKRRKDSNSLRRFYLLLNTITNSELKEGLEEFYSGAIKPEDIAKIIDFAIEQPDNVALNEIIVRPTKQEPQNK